MQPFEKTAAGVAELIRDAEPESIVFLAGAGISVAAGIPDFRSEGTGLYSQLESFRLPEPTAMFSINYLPARPRPFYFLTCSLAPSAFRPTLTHHFIALLEAKGKLRRVVTQNIDDLEQHAGVSPERVVSAHGTFSGCHCLSKLAKVPCAAHNHPDVVLAAAFDGAVPHCPECGSLIKPDVVFFGEGLPSTFDAAAEEDLPGCAVLVIAGTSLKVAPFNILPNKVKADTPRVLINREPAGGIGDDPQKLFKLGRRDVSVEEVPGFVRRLLGLGKRAPATDCFLRGDCDDIILEVARELGWEDELRARMAESDAAADAADAPAVEADADAGADNLTAVLLPPCLAPPVAFGVTVSRFDHAWALAWATRAQLRLLADAGCTLGDNVAVAVPASVRADVGPDPLLRPPEIEAIPILSPTPQREYTPLHGHWAAYCAAFLAVDVRPPEEGAADDAPFTDTWDLLTSMWIRALARAYRDTGDFPVGKSAIGIITRVADGIIPSTEFLEREPELDAALELQFPAAPYLAEARRVFGVEDDAHFRNLLAAPPSPCPDAVLAAPGPTRFRVRVTRASARGARLMAKVAAEPVAAPPEQTTPFCLRVTPRWSDDIPGFPAKLAAVEAAANAALEAPARVASIAHEATKSLFTVTITVAGPLALSQRRATALLLSRVVERKLGDVSKVDWLDGAAE